MLQNTVRLHGSRPMCYQKEKGRYVAHSYYEFYRDVRILGAALLRRGLVGKRIILTGENCYAWSLTYMATACGLGVIVPVDKEIPAEELANIARVSGAAAIVFSEKYREKAEGVGKKLQKFSFDDVLI
jgi:long-chain acyl-CoA synthetase